MFEITVQSEFAAAHAIMIAGVREPIHGHNWHVEVTLAGPTLDADGLLCDFHTAESALREIIAPYHNRNLNDIAPFADAGGRRGLNPSAENVARHVADAMHQRVGIALAPTAWIARVSVTEAPGCLATYVPPVPTP